MPLFTTLDTIEPTQHYVAPDFIGNNQMSKAGEVIFALSGHKKSGEKNTWGKIAGWVNPAYAMMGDNVASMYAKKFGASDSEKNIEQGFKRDIGKAITGAAIVGGVTDVVPPQQAMQLGMQGIGQITANPESESGVDYNHTYTSYQNGGEMKEDINMIDKETGNKVGEVSYNEGILSKHDYSILKKLYNKGDKRSMGDAIYNIMGRHKEINKDNAKQVDLADGGEISESKAKKILKDGKIRGIALTDKQKKYFGWVAGGRKEDGEATKYQYGGGVLPQDAARMMEQYASEQAANATGAMDAPSMGGIDFYSLFNKVGGAGQLVPLAQSVIGLINSKGQLPEYDKPKSWTDFIERMRRKSYEGLSPAEEAIAHRGNVDALALGVQNARNLSGGNSAFALGAQQALVPQYSRAEANIAATNQRLMRQNMADYGRYMGADANMDRQIFLDRYNRALMEKQAASQLAHTGLQGMLDRYDYERNRPLQEEYMKAMINRMNADGNTDNKFMYDYIDKLFSGYSGTPGLFDRQRLNPFTFTLEGGRPSLSDYRMWR